MYKFLLIEDSVEDAGVFQDTINRLNIEAGETIYHLDIAGTYDIGIEKISEKLNGIIVDIKLDDTNNGNDIIREVVEKYRVPVAIFTGTPDTQQEENSPIKVYKKGEAKHEEIIQELCAVSNTGLFNVLGGKGIIEQLMIKIFWENLYPQINLWKGKKEQGIDTEKILLRYAISHIQELIDNDVSAYVTEEMYISPPISNIVKTGSIIREKTSNLNYIVLSPPCDLAIHDGKMKTDCVLLCQIEPQKEVNDNLIKGITKKGKQQHKVETALKNNYTDYYHWLPANTLFSGGYINFRKIVTYSPNDLIASFDDPQIKIQESFVKNILNRFSAYYARQGQPDFDFEKEALYIIDNGV